MKEKARNVSTGKIEALHFDKTDNVYRNSRGIAFEIKHTEETGELIACPIPEYDKKHMRGSSIVIITLLIVVAVLAVGYFIVFHTDLIINHTAKQEAQEQRKIREQEYYEAHNRTDVPASVEYNGKKVSISRVDMFQAYDENSFSYMLYGRVVIDASELDDDEFYWFYSEDAEVDFDLTCKANEFDNDSLTQIGLTYDEENREMNYYFASISFSHTRNRYSFDHSSAKIQLAVKNADKSNDYINLIINDTGTIAPETQMDSDTYNHFVDFLFNYNATLNQFLE